MAPCGMEASRSGLGVVVCDWPEPMHPDRNTKRMRTTTAENILMCNPISLPGARYKCLSLQVKAWSGRPR
ncbi:hypothetical protein [Thermococcus sp. 5-4]|uniref:hypothetical protein n=1 Tax=Thermococcus sp. 5-4 TaxID=2008440 RepID=UPI00143B72F5|nr:hypothetical protein [Thermococcus sp. 5-4]